MNLCIFALFLDPFSGLGLLGRAECTKIAYCHSLAISERRLRCRREFFCSGNQFCLFESQRKSLFRFAKTFARYKGHLGPSGPKLEKEAENEFPRLSSGPKTVQNGVEEESKTTIFQLI